MSMKIWEIRSMSDEDLKKRLDELKLELIRLKTQAALGTLDNPGKIRTIRKTIARILTVLRERELSKKGGKSS